MGKKLHFIKSKLSFLVAVTLAAIVGGLSTNLVRASVPDAGGRVTVCYRNNGGDMHVIDTASDSCSNKETSLVIDQPASGLISLAGFDLSDSAYGDINFKFHDFRGADFTNTTLHGLMNYSDFRNANFTDADIDYLDVTGANFEDVDLSDMTIYALDITDANFNNVDFTDSNIAESNLSGVNLSSAIFTGVTWSNTVCPDGTNSNSHSSTCVGHLVP